MNFTFTDTFICSFTKSRLVDIDFTNNNTLLKLYFQKVLGRGGSIIARKQTQQKRLSEQTTSKALVSSRDMEGKC